MTAAQDQGDQYGLAFATVIGSMTLLLLRGDLQGLQERAGLCCRHCEKYGFAWWQYYAAAFLGWLIVMRGEPDAGIAAMHRAMAAWTATGMLLGPDSLAILLADATLEVVRRETVALPKPAAPAFRRRAWQGSTLRWRPTACAGTATGPSSTACAGSCCWRGTAWLRRTRRWRASRPRCSLGGRGMCSLANSARRLYPVAR